MAVYTHLGTEVMASIIESFDVGTLISAKGIAEGVSNSNWLIETETAGGELKRFILTVYESRLDTEDLPFFLGLLDHLAAEGCPVPRTIHDRDNQPFRIHEGKALALIEFLSGVSVSDPTADQARSVGAALAQIHLASAGFTQTRTNTMGLEAWKSLIGACSREGLAQIDPKLGQIVESELGELQRLWPDNLPHSVIHADLFPDNVLMRGAEVTGLIDFYFACTDITAYDVAVTHAAWCFSNDGTRFHANLSRALLEGYQSVRPLLAEEVSALPILARGASMRFLATRSYDWLNRQNGALVMPKDPMAFARRLAFYSDPANARVFETA